MQCGKSKNLNSRKGKTMKTAIIRKFGVLAVMAGIWFNAAGFSICAVGDSITQGGTAFTAHRVALEKEFEALGWAVEWKGTRQNATWGSPNPCEGYSGQNAEFSDYCRFHCFLLFGKFLHAASLKIMELWNCGNMES